VAAPTAIHKSDYLLNFQTNQFWFIPLYGCLSKHKDNNINFTISTAEKNEKTVKSYTDNPKHLHSEWGLKIFTEVHQLWLPKSHWIWNGSTKHSTIPVNTSKCYFHTGTYETETLRHAQQKLLLLGPKTYVWSTCQGLTHAVC